MCGIFGFFVDKEAGYTPAFIKTSLNKLALLSESRGKDSSGLIFRNEADRALSVLKGSVSISYMLKHRVVIREIDNSVGSSHHDPSVRS